MIEQNYGKKKKNPKKFQKVDFESPECKYIFFIVTI